MFSITSRYSLCIVSSDLETVLYAHASSPDTVVGASLLVTSLSSDVSHMYKHLVGLFWKLNVTTHGVIFVYIL